MKLVCKGVGHSGRYTHESSWCAIVSLLTSMLGHVLLCYTITYFTFSLTLQQLHIFTIYRKYFLTVCIYFCHIAQSQNNCSQYSQTTVSFPCLSSLCFSSEHLYRKILLIMNCNYTAYLSDLLFDLC